MNFRSTVQGYGPDRYIEQYFDCILSAYTAVMRGVCPVNDMHVAFELLDLAWRFDDRNYDEEAREFCVELFVELKFCIAEHLGIYSKAYNTAKVLCEAAQTVDLFSAA